MAQRTVVPAYYQHQPDITISLTIYNKLQETARRNFYMRNLSGSTKDEQVQQAKKIMNEVAEEIHYLTGFGIDKGVVRLAGQKAEEVIYPGYQTDVFSFHYGAMFQFSPVNYYAWVRDDQKSSQLYEDLLDDSWQVEVVSISRAASFRLPCVLINETHRRQLSPEEPQFFGFYPRSGRKIALHNFVE